MIQHTKLNVCFALECLADLFLSLFIHSDNGKCSYSL